MVKCTVEVVKCAKNIRQKFVNKTRYHKTVTNSMI